MKNAQLDLIMVRMLHLTLGNKIEIMKNRKMLADIDGYRSQSEYKYLEKEIEECEYKLKELECNYEAILERL